jgi:hypothetical protein
MAGLTAYHSGNLSDRGFVAIVGSARNESPSYAATNAVDFTNIENTFIQKAGRVNGSLMISRIAKWDSLMIQFIPIQRQGVPPKCEHLVTAFRSKDQNRMII